MKNIGQNYEQFSASVEERGMLQILILISTTYPIILIPLKMDYLLWFNTAFLISIDFFQAFYFI